MWWALTAVQGSQVGVWMETGVSLIVWWVCVMPMWHVYWLGVLGQWSTSGTSHNRVHTFLGPDPPCEAHIWVSSWAACEMDGGGWWGFWEMLQVHLQEGSNGVGWGVFFLMDMSSLPPRVAPCRVSDFFHHARVWMQLEGALIAFILFTFLCAIPLGRQSSYCWSKKVMLLYVMCNIWVMAKLVNQFCCKRFFEKMLLWT